MDLLVWTWGEAFVDTKWSPKGCRVNFTWDAIPGKGDLLI